MTDHEKTLVMAAAVMSRSSPEAWKRFLAEIEKRRWMLAKACVDAHPAALPGAQGRAKESFELFNALTDCEKTANELAANGKGPKT
jgi:hypothetical protein